MAGEGSETAVDIVKFSLVLDSLTVIGHS
jgi:hypothetical protein